MFTQKDILSSVEEGIAAISFLKAEGSVVFIEKTVELLSRSLAKGGKILIAGNGGSLCDAMHFAEELTGLYRRPRRALAAIALSDPGHMSCVANDLGYVEVFARGVEALGREGDVLVVLTTSGNSPNLLRAVETAQQKQIQTVAFLGKQGGALQGRCDLELCIGPHFPYSDRIQEAHMTAIHILIEGIEQRLCVYES